MDAGYTSAAGASSCTACQEGSFHGDGAKVTAGQAYAGMTIVGGTAGEASAASITTLTAVSSPTDPFAYSVIPNTCINCPANSYQPLRGQAATLNGVAGVCR